MSLAEGTPRSRPERQPKLSEDEHRVLQGLLDAIKDTTRFNDRRRQQCHAFLQSARRQAMRRPDYNALVERLTNQSTVPNQTTLQKKPWTKSPMAKPPFPTTTPPMARPKPAKPPIPRPCPSAAAGSANPAPASTPEQPALSEADFNALWGLMLNIEDTTKLGLVRKVKLRDFLLQARKEPMRRPSYDVLLARLTNQAKVPDMWSLMAKPWTSDLASVAARSHPQGRSGVAEPSAQPEDHPDDWQELLKWHQSECSQQSLGFRPTLGYRAAKIYGYKHARLLTN